MVIIIVIIVIRKEIFDLINLNAKIRLTTSQDVKDFVFVTSQFGNSVQVKVKHGNSETNGKSILGLLSLNAKGVLDLEVSGDGSITEQSVRQALNNWIVEGTKD